MAEVVVLVAGTRGDVEPLLTIAAALQRRGRDVALLTNCRHVPLASLAGVRALPVDDEPAFQRYLDDQPLLNDMRTVPSFYARHVVPAWPRRFEALRDECRGPRSLVICLALDGVPALCAAEAAGVPLVQVFISPAQALGAPFLADFIRARLAADVNAFRRQVGLPAVTDWRRWLGTPRASIGNWPPWFAPEVVGACSPVGFLVDESDQQAPAADLDALWSDRPVLISGGSGNFADASFYEAAAGGCERLGRPALVVTRRQDALPAVLPPGVRWVPEVSHAAVMPMLSAVIHHGGINTTARALRAGVPQLVLPMGHDRPDNAQRVERLAAGLLLPRPRWSAANVAAALDRLDTAAIRAGCDRCRRAMEDDGDSAARRAASIVETALP